jgi:hypothetical protein
MLLYDWPIVLIAALVGFVLNFKLGCRRWWGLLIPIPAALFGMADFAYGLYASRNSAWPWVVILLPLQLPLWLATLGGLGIVLWFRRPESGRTSGSSS